MSEFSDEDEQGGTRIGFVATPATEPTSGDSQETTINLVEELDLAWLRDFLGVLRDSGLSGFSGFGMSITFPVDQFSGLPSIPSPAPGLRMLPIPGPTAADAVDRLGAASEPRDGWRNPSLWPQQNGRTLKLDGSFE